jgi:hypothetical protein
VCPAFCLERGTHLDSLFSPISYHKFPSREHLGMGQWFANACSRAELGIVSYHPKPLDVFWVSGGDEYLPRGSIARGEQNTMWTDTYLGHRFVLKDPDTKHIMLDITVTENSFRAVGLAQTMTGKHTTEEFEHNINSTLENEWRRSRRVQVCTLFRIYRLCPPWSTTN